MSNLKKIFNSKILLSSKKLIVSTFAGAVIYALWALVYPLIYSQANDSVWERFLIQVPFILPVLLHQKLKITLDRIQYFSVSWVSVITGYHLYLAYINNSHPIYIAGTILAVTAIQFQVSSFVATLLVSATCIIGSGIILMIHPIAENVFLFLAMATVNLFGTMMLYYRLKLTYELLESKELIENQLLTLKQTQSELENQKEKSLVASRLAAMGEMSSTLAHELNNPLQIIQSNAQMIEKNLKSEDINLERIIDSNYKIKRTVERIGVIISSLKTFNFEELKMPKESILVSELIKHIEDICLARLQVKNIKLKIECRAGDQFLSIKKSQIIQVLLHLINNALDAVENENDPVIILKVSKNDQKIEFKVSNSGKILNQEIKNKLFTPFFTTKEHQKSSGLGLSVSKGYIEEHGGVMYLDEQDSLTTFVFKLPIQEHTLSLKASA